MLQFLRIIALSAFVVCVTGVCASTDGKQTARKQQTQDQLAEKRTEKLSKTLSLTDVQKKAVHRLTKEQLAAYHAAKSDNSLSMSQKQARMVAADSVYGKKLQSVLTPAQYQKWQAEADCVVMPKGKTHKADRHQMKKESRKGGSGRK